MKPKGIYILLSMVIVLMALGTTHYWMQWKIESARVRGICKLNYRLDQPAQWYSQDSLTTSIKEILDFTYDIRDQVIVSSGGLSPQDGAPIDPHNTAVVDRHLQYNLPILKQKLQKLKGELSHEDRKDELSYLITTVWGEDSQNNSIAEFCARLLTTHAILRMLNAHIRSDQRSIERTLENTY